jgi:ribosomal protein S18 acetylase RimI-like enzyme
MTLKPGVRLLGIKPEAAVALMVAQSIYHRHEVEMTVTSVVDGKHSRGSIHYAGFAFDLRSNGIPFIVMREIFESLKEQLGADFDVIQESDHVHCEYQPKEPL